MSRSALNVLSPVRIGADRKRFIRQVRGIVNVPEVRQAIIIARRGGRVRYEYLNPDYYTLDLIGLLEWVKLELMAESRERRMHK